MKLIKSNSCEAIQRIIWYYGNIHFKDRIDFGLLPTYHEVVPALITATELKALYGASKQFLNCTIDEVWEQSYNRKLGTHKGEWRTDFEGVTDNWSIPQEYEDSFVISCPDNITDYDLSAYSYTIIDGTV